MKKYFRMCGGTDWAGDDFEEQLEIEGENEKDIFDYMDSYREDCYNDMLDRDMEEYYNQGEEIDEDESGAWADYDELNENEFLYQTGLDKEQLEQSRIVYKNDKVKVKRFI